MLNLVKKIRMTSIDNTETLTQNNKYYNTIETVIFYDAEIDITNKVIGWLNATYQ